MFFWNPPGKVMLSFIKLPRRRSVLTEFSALSTDGELDAARNAFIMSLQDSIFHRLHEQG
jgi:hypothetical protein